MSVLDSFKRHASAIAESKCEDHYQAAGHSATGSRVLSQFFSPASIQAIVAKLSTLVSFGSMSPVNFPSTGAVTLSSHLPIYSSYLLANLRTHRVKKNARNMASTLPVEDLPDSHVLVRSPSGASEFHRPSAFAQACTSKHTSTVHLSWLALCP